MANNGGLAAPRTSGSECDGPSRGPSRVRSRVACRACNHRKVRCDVTRTGIPCSNCMHEVAACEVLPRKKHRPRRDRTAVQSAQSTSGIQHDDDHDDHVLPYAIGTSKSTSRNNPVASRNVRDSQVDQSITHSRHEIGDSTAQLVGLSGGQRLSSLENSPINFGGDSGKGLPASVDAEDALPDDSPLSYIGDRRGPRFFVYDLCHPEAPQDAMPYLLPRESDISWKPHEVEYLRHQGAFATLPDDVCDDLIRCYFHHVHFFLPIVDAASFLAEYNNNGRQNISLLLFWSMLLAAANFVEADVLRRAGFASRKAMKTAIYDRAKCLYDLDHGTDKLVLIQSVILMGFWYTDPQDHTGAWYWIGIAITLSQTLGLHRCPQLNYRTQRLPEAQQPLIRRIWWSCIVRDRWLSLAKGRPMRIHHEDCDIPMPGAEDILNNIDSIPIQTRSKFIPAESKMLAKMWVNLVEISSTLGMILRIHYRVNGPKPVVEDMNNSAEDLRRCRPREVLNDNAGDLLRLHAYHVELFYEATVAVLYRPYVLSRHSALPLEAQAPWQKMALDRARAAASNTNTVLEKIIDLDTVHLLKPMIITSLIPAMQIHLFDCKSTVPLRHGLGRNKLNLCMLVLSQLRDTYWSASVIYRLFERAQLMLDRSNSSATTQAEKPTVSSHRVRAHSKSNDADTEHQEQHHNEDQQQQQGDTDDSMRSMPEPNLLMNDQAAPFWPNNPQYFSNVDQLLSPGFSISEDAFQSFFMGYDDGPVGVYDQIIPVPSDVPADLLYNG